MGRDLDTVRLLQLWLKFVEFKSYQLEQSTMLRDYQKIGNRLVRMPDLPNPVAIRDYLLKTYSLDTAYRTLQKLSACCTWAERSHYISKNPFAPLLLDIRNPRRKSWIDTRAFTASERDAIIAAIADDKYCTYPKRPHSYYVNYIRFLFWTGCRLEECTPLLWTDIDPGWNTIHFCKALPADTRLLKDTKTHENRKFPINDRLRYLLKSICSINEYIFPSPKGSWIDAHNCLNRTWKPVVNALVLEGIVREYLPMKHTRQTFVTLALDAGLTPKDVAQLVGNTPEVINKFYAAPKPWIDVPEF